MSKLFFSYSHKDEALRNEIEVHLAMIRREGLITTWHDRRIAPGADIHKNISTALEEANIVLLLVSAHFLASNYCFDLEMNRALEKHKEGLAIVLPVILHPCDWHSSPFGHLRATPLDGKPISMFANQNEALAQIAKDVRAIAVDFSSEGEVTSDIGDSTTIKELPESNREQPPRSSNLRIKKSFSDSEVDGFLEESFEYMTRYFETSLHELEERNPNVTTRYRRIDANSFTASIYNDGSRASECSVWMGSGQNTFLGGIAFYGGITTSKNQYNESLSVENDGYSLFLRPMGMPTFGIGNSASQILSQEGAAEYYWSLLMSKLQ